ncbi:OmpA family protein [Rhodobacter capsulatus]|uniref:OmpA family protein n=1 Tax=Rhodobacter capsulatus TaxID=1061 RepID=UPI0040278DAB
MRGRITLLTTTAFVGALVLSAFIAGGSATIIEQRSRKAVKLALETASHSWVQVETDGLQVILLGTAPSEAARFRAVTLVSTVVDSSRIVDNTDAEVQKAIAPPDFSLQMLRNDEGISLIGLVPSGTDRKALQERLTKIAGEGAVTDMLESADYPVPGGWRTALEFGIAALTELPRAKVSILPGKVGVEAITDSPEQKAEAEALLNRRRPTEIRLDAKISAPRPVITPFTLRFLIDAEGARFDACSADTDRAAGRIMAAARKAGAKGELDCTVGMGVPSPQWAEAVEKGVAALAQLGAGTLTFSDADIALVAADTTDPAIYDRVVGDLESNLPEVFSLKAELAKKAEAKAAVPEFSALLREDGQVELRGRVTSDRSREALESFAHAQFGATSVYGATRVDTGLPEGWPLRTLTALEALRLMHEGTVTVTPDLVRLAGVTGDRQASDKAARLFARRLGEAAPIALSVKYDRRLDASLALPDGNDCVARLNGALARDKIGFEPSSATIKPEDGPKLDALAKAMAQCQDFRMEVAGHTDSQGSDEGNRKLSQARAEAVITALSARRVLTRNLTPKGYGESQPIAENDTDKGREANRRIEFVLLDAKPVGGAGQIDLPVTVPEPPKPAPVAPIEAVPDLVLDESAIAGAAPMEEAHGEPMPAPPDPPAETPAEMPAVVAPAPADPVATPPVPADPVVAAPASEAATTQAGAAEGTEAALVIPVNPAAQSPGHPKPRPKKLGGRDN